MMSTDKSIYDKALDPFMQGAITLGILVIFLILGSIMSGLDLMDKAKFPWTSAGSFMLFFGMFNSIFLLKAENLNRYWQRSIMAYVGIAVISSLLAFAISGISIDEAGSYRWIYLVLTFGYLAFMSIMGFIRFIFKIMAREEERINGTKID